MPACFQLTRKGETQPATLNSIDRELCNLLGVKEHPTLYVLGWYDFIGFKLATGDNFDKIRQRIGEIRTQDSETNHQKYWDDMLQCLDYLEQNFVPNCWHE